MKTKRKRVILSDPLPKVILKKMFGGEWASTSPVCSFVEPSIFNKISTRVLVKKGKKEVPLPCLHLKNKIKNELEETVVEKPLQTTGGKTLPTQKRLKKIFGMHMGSASVLGSCPTTAQIFVQTSSDWLLTKYVPEIYKY